MTEYFYVITIQWAEGGVRTIAATKHGIVKVHNGESQQTVYSTLHAEACKYFGAPQALSSVTCYYLVRNKL